MVYLCSELQAIANTSWDGIWLLMISLDVLVDTSDVQSSWGSRWKEVKSCNVIECFWHAYLNVLG